MGIARFANTAEQTRFEAVESLTLHTFRRDVEGRVQLYRKDDVVYGMCANCGCLSAPVDMDSAGHAKKMGFCI